MDQPVKRLLLWFGKNKRQLPWRKKRTLYSTWVSEVMLQQTQANTVADYFPRFMTRFPDVKALALAEFEEVLKVWEGLGYYARARNLHRAARRVIRFHAGKIPRQVELFCELPGVGPYISAAVMSIACGAALPVVDGNVMRVCCRWQGLADDIGRATTRRKVTQSLQAVIPGEQPGDFNEAMMELGALVCRPRSPDCRHCPLKGNCIARLQGRIAELPRRRPHRATPLYQVAVGLLVRRGRIFVQRRPDDGHLGGLWEFPGGKACPGETIEEALVRECAEELGVRVRPLARLADVVHAYSHFRIHLHLLACHIDRGHIKIDSRRRWIFVDDLFRLPFPGANRKLFPAICAYLGHSGESDLPSGLSDPQSP